MASVSDADSSNLRGILPAPNLNLVEMQFADLKTSELKRLFAEAQKELLAMNIRCKEAAKSNNHEKMECAFWDKHTASRRLTELASALFSRNVFVEVKGSPTSQVGNGSLCVLQ